MSPVATTAPNLTSMTSVGWTLVTTRPRGDPTRPRGTRPTAPTGGLGRPLAIMAWLAFLLAADRGAEAYQLVLGGATWLVLVALARRQGTPVRIQVAVVVLFATAVEYTFSAWLGVYIYRLGTVPAYVPPGHGLVYLAALLLSRSTLFRRHSRWPVVLTVVVGGGYAAWGLVASRPDVLGAVWFLCLLAFLLWGRSPALFAAVFVVVTYLELLGTDLGTWAWQPLDPTGRVSIGNPPSGVAGGYGWFDLVAVAATPSLTRWLHRLRT